MDKTAKILLIGAIAGALLWASSAAAAGPFICPVDGMEFATQEELTAHMAEMHPGVRIPIDITWS
jgi:hypothetical protein